MIRGVNVRASTTKPTFASRPSLAFQQPLKRNVSSLQNPSRFPTPPSLVKNTRIASFKVASATSHATPVLIGASVVQRLFAQQPSSKHGNLFNSYKKSAQQQQQQAQQTHQPPQDPNQYYQQQQFQQPQQQQYQPYQQYQQPHQQQPQQTQYQEPYNSQYPPAPYPHQQQQQAPYPGQPTYAYEPEEPAPTARTDLPDEVWNIQLQRYMKRVVGSVATGLGITAATTVLAAGYAPMMMGWTFAIPAMIVSIGAIMGVTMTRPTFHLQEMEHNGQRYSEIVSSNPPVRQVAALILYIALGLSITPLVTISWFSNPALVIGAAAATAAVMAGMVTYALRKPVGTFSRMEGPMTIALFGLIGVSLFAVIIKSSFLTLAACAGGVGIFSVLTAMDTHKAIESFHSGQPDHLRDSVSFYLNAVNLFSDILRLLRAFSGGD